MGFSSYISKYSSSRLRGAMLLGFFGACILLQATETQAQSSRFGARAGSRFTDTTTRRPYRRRQTPAARQSAETGSGFDYRLDDDSYESDFVEDAGLQAVGFCTGQRDCCCGDCVEASCGCDDGCCGESCGGGCCEPNCGIGGGGYGPIGTDHYPNWFVGFEWSFVKPRFSENLAYTTVEFNNVDTTSFTDTEFDYDLELTPRVWLGGTFTDSWSWRFTYWQFDQSPATETASPPDNDFGSIDPPSFGDVDISSSLSTEVFSFASDLNAYTIDIEALKHARVSRWLLGVGGGVRYASTEQNYFATRSDGTGVLDQIDYTHSLEGFGPTISLSGMRPLIHQVNIVCAARGSVLFGDGSSRLVAIEDETVPQTTIRVTNREDILPIGEARIGLEWMSPKHPKGWQWLLSTAMEGQIWGNAGNASSETADLGFLGFNFGAGVTR